MGKYHKIFGESAEEGLLAESIREISVTTFFLDLLSALIEEQMEGFPPVHEGEAVELGRVAPAFGEDD